MRALGFVARALALGALAMGSVAGAPVQLGVGLGLGLPAVLASNVRAADPTPGAEAEHARQLEALEQAIAAGASRSAVPGADRALALALEIGDRTRLGVTRSLRGRLFAALGEEVRAESEFAAAREALAEAPALLDAHRLNEANFEAARGRSAAAIEAYRSVAAGAHGRGDRDLEARARANALRARIEAGPGDAAVRAEDDLSRRAFRRVERSIDAVASPALRGSLRLHLARSLELLRTSAPTLDAPSARDAHRWLSGALADADLAGSTSLRAEALGALGALYESEGRLAEAADLTDRALAQARRSEAGRSSARLPLQAGRIRLRMGELERALEHHAEAVAIVGAPRADAAAVRPTVAGRRAFASEDAAAYRGLVDLLLRRAATRPDVEGRRADLREAQAVLERFRVAELRDHFADDCVDRHRASRKRVDDAEGSFLVVYPVILEDRLELLVSRRDWIEQRSVAISRNDLEKLARQYRGLLEDRTTRLYLRPAQALHAALIEPIADLIAERKPETLVVVPDGILRTIPFAALHDGRTHLIERIALATTPSLELSDPRPFDRSRVASLYGGLTTAVQGFDALPQVEEEIATANRYLPGTVLLDESFSRAAVVQKLSSESFDLVHVASHAQFTSAERGGFLLTHDGKLPLAEFRQAVELLQYRDRPLELLILSACETAAGDERAALGFSGAAVQAGARSVLGSLWLVQDEATSVLLARFYAGLAEPGVSRAEAMRRAQRALIEDPAYAHPSAWAAFLLINSWL
jgi:CHAT domain-containing protein/VIT1/CCC1 family predicted Fe2+/Mn2+ transporter